MVLDFSVLTLNIECLLIISFFTSVDSPEMQVRPAVVNILVCIFLIHLS